MKQAWYRFSFFLVIDESAMHRLKGFTKSLYADISFYLDILLIAGYYIIITLFNT